MGLKKNILILCTDNYSKQPRVLRTIEALENKYTITVAGNSNEKNHKLKFIDLSTSPDKESTKHYWHFDKPALLRLPVSFYYKYIKQKQFIKFLYYEQQYWTASKKANLECLQQQDFDLIISHGIDTLPLGIKLAKKKVPVIFNAHEYYPLEFEQDPQWLKTEGAKAKYIIKKYLPECSGMFCVSENIMKEYQKSVSIKADVITNATSYSALAPTPTSSLIKLIHHGAAIRARKIELMADMMFFLDENYVLYFMLVPTDELYLKELEKKYSSERIKFIDPVPVSEIASECNKYDIGLFILPPVNFNWLNALPNKLFEFVQGRLAIAVSPNPDMKKIVEKYNLGVVADDYTPKAMADKIRSLDINALDRFKANSRAHAKELSAEANQNKIREVVAKLLN